MLYGERVHKARGPGTLSSLQGNQRHYELSVLYRYDDGDQNEGCRERARGVWMAMSDMRGSNGLSHRSTPTMAFGAQVQLGAYSDAGLLRDVVKDAMIE